MPTGKNRTNKRSSGVSSTSTITTVIFVSLSVLGIWLLTSNSFTPSQTTSTTPSQITSIATSTKSNNEDRTILEESTKPVYTDKTEPVVEVEETPKEEESSGSNSSNESTEEVASTEEHNDVQEKQIEEDTMKNEPEPENPVEEKVKQVSLDTQTTEESPITQKQEVEKVVEEVTKQPEKKEQVKKVPEKPKENEISEEDQQKRLEQHQKQEDAQIQESEKDPKGATSKEQIQHDEAPIFKDTQEVVSKKSDETFPNGESAGIPKESKESKKAWATQADQSEDQKERRNVVPAEKDGNTYGHTWQLCNVTAGQDYIPCLDNEKAIALIRHRNHYEHRERHCPDETPTCLVPLPKGYKRSIEWPQSRDKIWYHNVPHTLLAEVKGHQNWVKLTGEFLTFPGGGTQFIHGALHYIDFIQEAVADIAWGKHTRVILDVGCGVASFGGFLFERDVLAMSLAPKDEHEAQVQFALERGIPAISAVMGTQRLPYPSRVFDVVHCARCRVPWHIDGGALLLELNRVLRPGGYFVWSATPVYQTLEEDVQIWQEMTNLTVAMCWELVTIKKDKLNSVGAAIYHKPDSNDCYEQRKINYPPMCKDDDDPNAAWYVPLQSCMHRVPTKETERGSQWPEEWPKRVQTPPYWLNKSQMGIYGKPAPDDFASDYEHWKGVVSKSYMTGLGISWKNVRNVMDMRAVYGGFAAALKDLKVWVMNVVNTDSPDTLPIIYERGLFGIYHDWCESFSTYPRTYDLLHADHLFSRLKKRCKLEGIIAEIDRIVRPGGKLIVRDESRTVGEVENLLKSLHWEIHLTFSKNQEGILSAQKSEWRPETYAPPP